MSFLDRLANRAFQPGQIEVRASSQAATGNLSYHTPGQVSMPDYDAASAVNNFYNGNTYIHAAVRRVAEDIAALPFRAGLDPEVPKNSNLRAPITKFLGAPPLGPNPMMTARQLWAWSIAQYIVTGKFGWLIERDGAGQVIGLWPLVSHFLFPIRSEGGRQYFKGFRYGQPGTSAFQTLDASDVVYVYRPSASDPKEPESVLRAAKTNIHVANAIDQFEYNFYRNNAVPAYMVFTPPFAEPENRRAFQDQWRSEYTGPANAGKVMFLESGYSDDYGDTQSAKDQVMVQQLGTNAEDAQTTEARNSHIQDIAVAIGVPLSVLGDSTHSKFQNADMDERNYWRHTVLARAMEIMDQVNLQLAPLLGRELGFWDFSGVAALSPEKTIKPAEGLPLVLANVITRDELRGMHGLGAYADVDPTNAPVLVPAGIPGVTAAPGPVTTEAPAPEDVPPVRLALVESRHAGDEHLPIPSGHLHESTKPEHKIKAWETLLNQQLQALMAEQETHVLGRLSGRKGKRSANADSLYDSAYWLTRTENLLAPVFRALELGDSKPTSEALVEDISTSLALLLIAERDSDALQVEIKSLWAGRAERLSDSILAPLKPTHVPFDSAQSIFTRFSAGELTLEAALAAVEGAA